jgi:hypothetical protein
MMASLNPPRSFLPARSSKKLQYDTKTNVKRK